MGLWGYMLFKDVSNFLMLFEYADTPESERINFWWWMIESVFFWNFWTLFSINFIWLMSFIPMIGPIVNLVWVFLAMVFVFG